MLANATSGIFVPKKLDNVFWRVFFPLYWNKFSSENYGRLSPCSNLEVCLRRVLSMLCILFGFPPIVACVAGVSKNLTKVNETGRECEKIRSRGRSEASDSFLHTPSSFSLTSLHFSPVFCSCQACSFARPLFRSRVRSPPGKEKKTAATQVTSLK